jgi:GNAT superfamily N-acetyltransferase
MVLDYRFADTVAAPAIAALLTATWSDDTADEGRITRVLADSNSRATAAAYDSDRLVGFVDGFLTVDSQGTRRWEVDLLAVDVVYHNQGIARRLITNSIEEGRRLGATVARALVHADNVRASKAFARAGFRQRGDLRTLVICTDPLVDAVSDPSIFMIPVATFTYIGWWVEGSYTASALQAARHHLSLHSGDLVGAVATPADVLHAEACGYFVVGNYRWWQRDL